MIYACFMGFTEWNWIIKIYNISRILSKNFNLIRVIVSQIQRFKAARSRLPAGSLKTWNVFFPKLCFQIRLSNIQFLPFRLISGMKPLLKQVIFISLQEILLGVLLSTRIHFFSEIPPEMTSQWRSF